jgi:hypothetical protein
MAFGQVVTREQRKFLHLFLFPCNIPSQRGRHQPGNAGGCLHGGAGIQKEHTQSSRQYILHRSGHLLLNSPYHLGFGVAKGLVEFSF